MVDIEAGGPIDTITATEVTWKDGSIALADLLSAHALDAPPRLVLDAYPRKKAGKNARKHAEQQVACATFEQAKSAAAAVNKALRPAADPAKKILVLINPFGGGGIAPSRWKKLDALVAPAGLTLEVIETTHAGHARELMATLPIGDYHAICTVSGDGLVYEVINGLLSRDDGREAVQKLPLSPAPGGTGNGLFASICHKAGEPIDIIGAAFLLVKGKPAPLDLWEYVRPATSEVRRASKQAQAKNASSNNPLLFFLLCAGSRASFGLVDALLVVGYHLGCGPRVGGTPLGGAATADALCALAHLLPTQIQRDAQIPRRG